MYEVIVDFIDLRDNNHAYKVGDKFPHDGVTVSDKRIDELAGDKNKRKMPLIQRVKEDKKIVKETVAVDGEVEFMNPPVESVAEQTVAEVVKKPRKSRKK